MGLSPGQRTGGSREVQQSPGGRTGRGRGGRPGSELRERVRGRRSGRQSHQGAPPLCGAVRNPGTEYLARAFPSAICVDRVPYEAVTRAQGSDLVQGDRHGMGCMDRQSAGRPCSAGAVLGVWKGMDGIIPGIEGPGEGAESEGRQMSRAPRANARLDAQAASTTSHAGVLCPQDTLA